MKSVHLVSETSKKNDLEKGNRENIQTNNIFSKWKQDSYASLTHLKLHYKILI